DTQSYSVAGTDAASFTIDNATGVLTFNAAPDHELKSSYEVDVIVTDGGSLTDTQTLTITVNDVNEAPVIASNGGGSAEAVTVDENQTAVTTVVATDVDDSDTQSYSLGGTDAAAFTIDSATGVLTFNTAPDHELKSSYEVDVIVTDSGTGSLTATQTLTITVNDINEAPLIISNGGGSIAVFSVDENQTDVTTVAATDVDDGDMLSYSLGGTDAAAFTIDSATGVLTFNTAPDHELNSSYEVDVIVTDSATGSLTDMQTLTITVNDVNEAPVITSLGGEANATVSVDENQMVITTLTSTDVDGDTLTYSLAGIDENAFNIGAVSGVLSFDPATDTLSLSEYVVDVIVTDNGSGLLTDTQTITISVDDINFHPVITSNFGGEVAEITLNENQLVVTTVTSIDADGDLQTYSLTGSDVSAFSIDGKSGLLRFNQAPNFENKNIYTIDVMVTDNGVGALTDSQTLNILVNDVNEPPVMVIDGVDLISSISVDENQLDVVSVEVNDEDRQDAHVFSISGGVDQLSFSINSNSGDLTFIDTPDYETKDEYFVEITVTDSAGLTDVKSLAVTINDINESPTITTHGGEALAFLSIEENQFQVTRISASDVDENDIQRYSIVGGADADSFVIDPIDGSLRFKDAPDFEVPGDRDLNNVYEVVVQVSDANGGIDLQDMKITLLDGAEEPIVRAATPITDSESSLPLFGFDRVSSGVELILPSKKAAVSPIGEIETSQPVKVFEDIIETDAEATIAHLFGVDLSEAMDSSDSQQNRWAVLSDTILTEYLAGQRVGWDHDDGADYRVDIFDDSINIANIFAMLQQNDSEMFAMLSDNSDKQREQIEKNIAESRMFMGSAITTTSGLSIGYFLYLIRGGAIMSSMLTSLPAWRFVDPLPILGSLEGSLHADQESLQSIVGDSDNAALNRPGK
ncbi:MAG: cadherin domain-containing protein, partial [Granulosicoccus sp.]